jgi:hypothetical protein
MPRTETPMLEDSDLDAAVEAGLIDHELRARLERFAVERRRANLSSEGRGAPAPRFEPVHILYYAGALLVVGAMGLFANSAFLALGGWALAGVAVVYAAGSLTLGRWLWPKRATRLPGGLCVAIAVSMAPLAIYGAAEALNPKAWGEPGLFPASYPTRILMELGAIAAAVIAVRHFPFPFIVMIAALAAWLLATDLTAFAAHGTSPEWEADFPLRRRVSEIVGLVMIAAAWFLDLRRRRRGDFGFWPHILGAIILWGAVTLDDDFGTASYCAFSVAFIAFGVFMGRRIYVVLGAIGVAAYFGHLAFHVFRNTAAFSFALSAIGLAVVLAAILLERRRGALSASLDAHLPGALRALRPPRARRV